METMLSGFSWHTLLNRRRANGVHMRLPSMIPKGNLHCFMSLFPTLFPFISSTQRSGCERRLARW